MESKSNKLSYYQNGIAFGGVSEKEGGNTGRESSWSIVKELIGKRMMGVKRETRKKENKGELDSRKDKENT